MATKNEKPQDEQVPAEELEKKAESVQPESKEKKGGSSAVGKTKSQRIVVDVKAKEPASQTQKKSAQSKTANKVDDHIEIDLDIDPGKKAKKEPRKTAPKSTNEKVAAEQEKESAGVPLNETKPESSPILKTEPPASGSEKHRKEKSPSVDRSALVFGGGLLVMGVVLMLGRLFEIPFGVFLWPFIFIIPGVLVLLAALSSDNSSGEGLSILGGILTSLGVLFLAQSISGWWGSWAYAWTLVVPTSVGFAQLLYGQNQNREEIIKSGRRLIKLGLSMFVVGFVFFELVLGVSGYGLNRIGLPVFPMILIFSGLLVLINSFRRNSH
jgi:hypothetical protein